MPNGRYTSTETTSYSEQAASDSPFDFFATSPPVSSAFSATSTDSTTSSHHASPAPSFMSAAHAQQFAEMMRTRAQSAAGFHQQAASFASFRPSSAASNLQQDRFNSPFTPTGDGIRVHTTLQPEDIPDSGSSSAHTPRVQPFGIPDMYGQMPQNIVEELNMRAAEMTPLGRTTTTTTTTTHRATPPQMRTVHPIPVNVAPSGAYNTSFRESMQTSGGMSDEMRSNMMGDMFDSLDLDAHVGIRSGTPGRTRTVFSGMTSGGTSSSSTPSMSSEEHFRASGRSGFRS
ncbi:hypothetical protein PHLGIDRAFT_117399 [Phlebiopsis gigantea 11061_1 CR5-6]|uniref:Uncharacterized protein n=1 Tax=Phlebiopsis gigantea (strain 11061_1 CR5-6) TaxID=745531 RepID=A0A0C3S0D0_PHLG1|nr:hypothetical protein PHLGIDRAFT_117399 [Phlebiopsis gigantea 11061_1 CR5-6]